MGEEAKIGIKVDEEAKPLKKLCEKLEESINAEFNKGIEQIDVMEMKEAIDMLKDLYEAKEKLVKGCYYKYLMCAMEKEEEKEAEGEDDEEDGMMDDGRRGYRGQPRSASGRFMRRGDGRRSNRGRGRRGYEEPVYFTMTPEMYHEYSPEYWRDMDREHMGRMYYNGGSTSSGGQSIGNMGGGSMQGGGNTRGYEGSRQSEGGNYSARNQQSQERDSREGRSGQSRRSYMESKELNMDKQSKMKELENYTKELAEDVTEMISGATPEEKNLLKTKMQTLIQKIG